MLFQVDEYRDFAAFAIGDELHSGHKPIFPYVAICDLPRQKSKDAIEYIDYPKPAKASGPLLLNREELAYLPLVISSDGKGGTRECHFADPDKSIRSLVQ